MLTPWGVLKGLLVQNESDRTKEVNLEVSDSATTATRTTISAAQTLDRTLTLPDATDTLTGRATTDTFTNKSIDADNNTISNLETDNLKAGVLVTDISLASANTELPSALAVKTALAAQNEASEITYDNTSSGLSATNVQDAIDEVESRVDTTETNIATKVTGPASATDNAIVRFDLTTGKLVQNSGVTISDVNAVAGITLLTVDNLQLDGNTLSATSGDLILDGADIDANTNVIKNVVDPTNPQDAATKAYVDAQIGGGSEFSDADFRIQDNGDATKELAFEVSAITTATTRTITIPDSDLNLSTSSGGSFANNTLSNLQSPTAINQDLIPSGTRNIGTTVSAFNIVFADSLRSPGATPLYRIQGGQVTPSGASVSSFTSNTTHVAIYSSVAGQNTYIETENSGSATTTGDVNVKTGNNTSTGGSGDINLEVGSVVSGTRGSINANARQLDLTNIDQSIALPTWHKYTVAESAFTASATSEDIELFSLPAKGVIHNVVIKHTAAFTGGTLTAFTLSVGIAGDLTKYASAFDVFQAPGDTVAQTSTSTDVENFGSSTSIRLAAESVGDDVVNATAGSVDVYVLWGILP